MKRAFLSVLFLLLLGSVAAAEETLFLEIDLKVEMGETRFLASPKLAAIPGETAEIIIEDDSKVLKVLVNSELKGKDIIALNLDITADGEGKTWKKTLAFTTISGVYSRFKDEDDKSKFLVALKPLIKR